MKDYIAFRWSLLMGFFEYNWYRVKRELWWLRHRHGYLSYSMVHHRQTCDKCGSTFDMYPRQKR